jgi:hypothetical protein
MYSADMVELWPAVKFPEQDPDCIPSYLEKRNRIELMIIDLESKNLCHYNEKKSTDATQN